MAENTPNPATAQMTFGSAVSDEGLPVVWGKFGEAAGNFDTRQARGLGIGILQVAERAETEAIILSWLSARWGNRLSPEKIADLLNDYREFAVEYRQRTASPKAAAPAPPPEPKGEVVRLFENPQEQELASRLKRLEAELADLRGVPLPEGV